MSALLMVQPLKRSTNTRPVAYLMKVFLHHGTDAFRLPTEVDARPGSLPFRSCHAAEVGPSTFSAPPREIARFDRRTCGCARN